MGAVIVVTDSYCTSSLCPSQPILRCSLCWFAPKVLPGRILGSAPDENAQLGTRHNHQRRLEVYRLGGPFRFRSSHFSRPSPCAEKLGRNLWWWAPQEASKQPPQLFRSPPRLNHTAQSHEPFLLLRKSYKTIFRGQVNGRKIEGWSKIDFICFLVAKFPVDTPSGRIALNRLLWV